MSADRPQPQEAELIYVIGRVEHGIRRQLRIGLRELGLSVQEYTALSVLRSRPGLSNAQLARRSLVTPQSMLEILAKLQRRGLVEREVDPSHARILRARLTPDGRRLVRRAEPIVDDLQERLLAEVAPEDRGRLLESMTAAMRSLSATTVSRRSDRAAAPRSP